MKVAKDDYNFFDYDCDLKKRLIYLGGKEIGIAVAERTVKALLLMDIAALEGDKPINIIMNNPGGDVYHCAAIYDAIKSTKNPVHINVYGMAMSAASVILQAADVRRMSPSSVVMIHYGTGGSYDHPKITYNWADEGKRLDGVMEQIYLKRIQEKNPKYKLKDLQKLLDFDTILSAAKSLELGLVDEIIEPHK